MADARRVPVASKSWQRVGGRWKFLHTSAAASDGHASIPGHELYCLSATSWQVLKGWRSCEIPYLWPWRSKGRLRQRNHSLRAGQACGLCMGIGTVRNTKSRPACSRSRRRHGCSRPLRCFYTAATAERSQPYCYTTFGSIQCGTACACFCRSPTAAKTPATCVAASARSGAHCPSPVCIRGQSTLAALTSTSCQGPSRASNHS